MRPHRHGRPALRLWAVSLLALAFASAATGAEPAFELDLDVPFGLRGVVRGELELLRWQQMQTGEVDAALLRRLTDDAQRQARELLASRGYFEPAVSAEVDGEAAPMRVALRIAPGPQTRVAAIDLALEGPLSERADGEGERTLAELRKTWHLRVGQPFTQADWAEAKRRAVAHVARRYPAARVAASEAFVDPASAEARLSLRIASGPEFRFGDLEIRGPERHPPERVANLVTYDAGDAYDRELLDRFQRRIAATGYYASAQVEIDADEAAAEAANVRVAVIEAPARRAELGLGYSTDAKVRGSAEYRDNDVLARSLRLRLRVEADSLVQRGEAELRLPERVGWSDSLGSFVERSEIEDLTTEEFSVIARSAALAETSRPEWSATFSYSRQRAPDVLSESVHALLFEYTHTWRALDDLQSPRQGWMSQIAIGGAPPGVSTRGFGRTITRAAWFQPLGRRDDFSLRAEAGAVFASSSRGIPQSMLFRTGGSTSVRGYDFEALGVDEDGAVIGGRYFGVASAEYTHWFRETIGGALFVDAGNAWDSVDRLKLALGYGAGLRAASPIGPLRFDLAWGEQDDTLRVHFSLGITF
jgi:translocation and assembly module TamA